MSWKRRRLWVGTAAGVVAVLLCVALTHHMTSQKKEGGETSSAGAVRETVVPSDMIQETAPPEQGITEENIASFLQGPKSWKQRREWSGKWGKTLYDGSSFGAFGCGLCCMANIYCSLTDYCCSPVDMYDYAKKMTEYGGGGAIDWPYMKDTLKTLGFTCEVGCKPDTYEEFQQLVKNSQACLVVVSSRDSTCYWKNTPGHYVVLFLYDAEKDKIFLTDSGDPKHNRHWVSLNKVYRSLKTANYRQYLTVTSYDEQQDQWRHTQIGGVCVLPEQWKSVSQP